MIQTEDDTSRVAAALAAKGIGPGDVVASWAPPDVYEAVLVANAATRLGATVMQLDPTWDVLQVKRALDESRPKLLVIRAFFDGIQPPAMIKSIRRELPYLQDVVIHGREPRFERVLPGGWLDFLDSGAARQELHAER